MHAVLLAGGEGRRLAPLTDSIPKALVPVGDEPVLAIVLKLLVKQGVRTVDLAVNHHAEKISQAIGDGSQFGLDVKYYHEATPLSTIGPLTLIEKLPEQFLVMNADVLTDLPVDAFYQYHCNSGAALTVATTGRIERTDFGVIETNSKKMVTGFAEKPSRELTVSMGIYAIRRELVNKLEKGKRFGFDDLMLLMLKQKWPVQTFPWDSYWLDIGRPDDYERAREDTDRYKSWLL
jgi:mannose-1-phosphate guanylyltransferase